MPPAGKSGRKSKGGTAGTGALDAEKVAAGRDEEADVDENWLNYGLFDDENAVMRMKSITAAVMSEYPVTPAFALHLVDYEQLLRELITVNERLKGRLEVLTSGSYLTKMATAAVKAAVKAVVPVVQPVAAPAVAPVVVAAAPAVATAVPVAAGLSTGVPVPKAVETWSVVVRGKKGVTSKEVMEKVVKQVGPTLGVRVHEVKPVRDGGAIIRTPSIAEQKKLVENRKFKELGLEVRVNEKAGPRVDVSGVHGCISSDEFMSDLFEMNFSDCMTKSGFKKKVRLVTKPWPAGEPDTKMNVVLEGEEGAMRQLLEAGRVYVKWFAFRTKLQDSVSHCFRCLGFDQRIRQCRSKEQTCRLCGEEGHVGSQCLNEVKCRNCAIRKLPADHAMLSYSCPHYAGLLARANARH